MANKVILTIGHAFMPVAVKVKQSSLLPDTFYVESFINGTFLDELVVRDETAARAFAQTKIKSMSALLLPIYNTGFDDGIKSLRPH